MDSNRRAARWRVVAGAAALALLAACSSPDTPQGASGTADATPARGVPDAPLDWCALMPLPAVNATLSARIGRTVTGSRRGAGGMCSYAYVDDHGDYTVKLLIDISRLRDADTARQAMAAHRQDFANVGRQVEDVAGLGDAAFAVTGEAMGVVVRQGPYYGQINLAVDSRGQADLEPAVHALARQALASLR